MKLKLGIPQGRLQSPVIELFRLAGFNIKTEKVSHYPTVDDPNLECVLVRAEEMSSYAAEGIIDAGITDDAWIKEYEAATGSRSLKVIEDLCCPSLGLGLVQWVLAVPNDSTIESIRELEYATINSELFEFTKLWLAENGVNAHVAFSWGATELQTPALARAIVRPEIKDAEPRRNALRTVATLIENSKPRLVCRQAVLNDDSEIRTKLDQVRLLLKAAISAQDKVRLVVQAPCEHESALAELIGAIVPMTTESRDGTVTLTAIVSNVSIRDLIPRLKGAGAKNVIETRINKFIA